MYGIKSRLLLIVIILIKSWLIYYWYIVLLLNNFFLQSQVYTCKPRALYICDGSHAEAEEVTHKLIERGVLTKLKKYENW